MNTSRARESETASSFSSQYRGVSGGLYSPRIYFSCSNPLRDRFRSTPVKGEAMKTVRMLLAAASLSAGQACAHGGLADLSVYDRTEGRRLQVYWHEGRAYVVGKPGNEYQVSLRNRGGDDVLAVVSVDGVNVLSGETASMQQGGYVVSPGRRVDIRGWRKSLGEIASFDVTSRGA